MTTLTITYKNIILTIEIEHYSPFVPGRYTGPNEECCEDIQEEIEWRISDAERTQQIGARAFKNLLPPQRQAWVEYIHDFNRFRANLLTVNERQEIHTLISKQIAQRHTPRQQHTPRRQCPPRRQHMNPSVMPSIRFSGSQRKLINSECMPRDHYSMRQN